MKKNRFSMLGTKKTDSENVQMEKKSDEPSPVEIPKEVKVIVKAEDFERNLKVHQLKKKKKGFEQQKEVIRFNIEQIKKIAYLKIYVGILLIAYTLYDFMTTDRLENTEKVPRTIILLGIGILILIFSKKRK